MSQAELIAPAPPVGPTLGTAPAAATANPVTATAPAPAPAVSTEAAPAPAAAGAEAPPAPVTLLGTVEAPKGDAPSAEVVPPEAPKPEITPEPDKPLDADVKTAEVSPEGSKSDEPAPLPTYDAFELPEGVTLDPDRIGTFSKYLGEFETKTKADHAEVQSQGQRLVTEFTGEIQQAVDRVGETYRTLWDKQKTDWKDEFLNDPDLGGNRFQTTLDAANKFIRTHGGSEAEQVEFRTLLESSGLGNHKAMIRILAKAGSAMGEARQLAAPKPAPLDLSKVEKMYGRNK